MQIVQDVVGACRMLNGDLQPAAVAAGRRRGARAGGRQRAVIERFADAIAKLARATPTHRRERRRRRGRREDRGRRRHRDHHAARRADRRRRRRPRASQKDIAKCDKEIAAIDKRLDNAEFIAHAPEEASSPRTARAAPTSSRAQAGARRRARHAGVRMIDVRRLETARAALLVVDIQDRLVPAMPEDVAARVLRNTAVLIETARAPRPADRRAASSTPRASGRPCAPIEQALAAAVAAGARVHRFDKLEFSAAAAPAFVELAPHLPQNQWLVAGMEAHVCVYQTARDLRGARRRGPRRRRRRVLAREGELAHRPRPRRAPRERPSRRPRCACSTCSGAPAVTTSARSRS